MDPATFLIEFLARWQIPPGTMDRLLELPGIISSLGRALGLGGGPETPELQMLNRLRSPVNDAHVLRELEQVLREAGARPRHVGPAVRDPFDPSGLSGPMPQAPPSIELTDDVISRLVAGETVDPYDPRPQQYKQPLTIQMIERATQDGKPVIVVLRHSFENRLRLTYQIAGFRVVDGFTTYPPRTLWEWLTGVPNQRVVVIRQPSPAYGGSNQLLIPLDRFREQFIGRGIIFE